MADNEITGALQWRISRLKMESVARRREIVYYWVLSKAITLHQFCTIIKFVELN